MSEVPETAPDHEAPPKPPPGYYAWGNEGRQRWWDGERWANQWGIPETPYAQAPAAPQEKEYRGLQIWGWFMAVLFPGLGLVLGIILITKHKNKPGIGIVSLAIAMMIVTLIYLVATGNDQYRI